MTEDTKKRLKFWLKALGILGFFGGWALLGWSLMTMAKKENAAYRQQQEGMQDFPFLEKSSKKN